MNQYSGKKQIRRLSLKEEEKEQLGGGVMIDEWA